MDMAVIPRRESGSEQRTVEDGGCSPMCIIRTVTVRVCWTTFVLLQLSAECELLIENFQG